MWNSIVSVFKNRTSGQGLVELALLLPLIMLILTITLDFGRVFYFQMRASEAAREAVRIASFPQSSDAEIKAVAVTALGSLLGVTAGDVNVTPTSYRTTGESVKVAVTYDFALVTPYLSNLVDPSNVHGGKLHMSTQSTALVQ